MTREEYLEQFTHINSYELQLAYGFNNPLGAQVQDSIMEIAMHQRPTLTDLGIQSVNTWSQNWGGQALSTSAPIFSDNGPFIQWAQANAKSYVGMESGQCAAFAHRFIRRYLREQYGLSASEALSIVPQAGSAKEACLNLQAKYKNVNISRLHKLEPGALIYFPDSKYGHVVIYVGKDSNGNDLVIHNSSINVNKFAKFVGGHIGYSCLSSFSGRPRYIFNPIPLAEQKAAEKRGS